MTTITQDLSPKPESRDYSKTHQGLLAAANLVKRNPLGLAASNPTLAREIIEALTTALNIRPKAPRG